MSSIIRNLFDWILCFWRGRQTCDLRFSLQGRYASVLDLSPFGITNTAVTIPGRALLAGDGITEEQFIAAALEDGGDAIKARLKKFLESSNLQFGLKHLVIFDMEPSYPDPADANQNTNFSPAQLGRYEDVQRSDGSSMQDALIKAYSQRIIVAREVLLDKWPTVKIGLYGVVVPDGKGEEDARFNQRMQGYTRAGDLGMYDHVDYLVPVLYTRFGEIDASGDLDRLHGWIEQSARQAITNSQKLTRHKGKGIPLAPLLTFWVANGNSLDNRNVILLQTLGLQLRVLRSYCSVEIIVLWSGKETKEEMESDPDFNFDSLDISNFLGTVDELPLSGCK